MEVGDCLENLRLPGDLEVSRRVGGYLESRRLFGESELPEESEATWRVDSANHTARIIRKGANHMFDVIIKGGQVIDGTGAPRVQKDIGIKGDSISAIGDLSGAEAATTIDAAGQVVSPGFIDMHNHFDQTILLYPHGQSAIAQGITTAVTGQCGFSPAPLNAHYTTCFWEYNWWDRVQPRKYDMEVVADLTKVKQAAKEFAGLDISWSSFGEWVEAVRRARPGLNIIPLVGHSTVRTAVMGEDYRRHATPDEIAAMKRYVEQAMDEGAAGISNGMDYAPNSYCSVQESYEVIGAAAKKNGIFSSHWRRTGLRRGFGNPGLIDGIKEAIDIAKVTGARLEIAHLSPGYLISPSPTAKLSALAAEETLAVLDNALADGVDLAFDVIPNHQTGGVLHVRHVAAYLDPWLREAGSPDALAKRLEAPDYRKEIWDYLMSGKWYMLNPIINRSWAKSIVIGDTTVKEFEGRSIADLAKGSGEDPLYTLMDVVRRDPNARLAPPREGSDEVKRIFYGHKLAMVGIDTFIADTTMEVTVPPYYLPNPNTYGGMARFIRLYANGLLGLEEGIHRLTGLPASRLDLQDRGVLAVGKKADIVVFKPDEVTEKGTVEEPREYPSGFSWVFVNGVAAMADGKLTLSGSGEVLTRR